MLTINDRLDGEIRKLIAAEIEKRAEELAGGNAADHAAYRFACGHIHGLKEAIEFIEIAETNILGRQGA